MVSTGVADAFGAVGGGVLAACLLPQLWKLVRTRSAADISLPFLLIYLLGLVVSFVYLYYEDAIVAWACLLVEIGCVLLMVTAKVYLDRWGPHSRRALRRPRPEAAITSSLSFADTVGLSIKDAGSAFAQLLQPEALHAAQHLLLDVRLCLPLAQQPAHSHGDTAAAGAAAEGSAARIGRAGWHKDCGVSSSGAGSDSIKAGAATNEALNGCAANERDAGRADSGNVLAAVAEMAAATLASAGMPALHRHAQTFHSFRQRPAGDGAGAPSAAAEAEEAAGAEAAGAPAPLHMLYLAFRGGYAAFIWHAASATLSLDLFAASDGAGARAAHAAQQLCEQLLARWPGSHIEASSVARLPRHEAEQQQSAGLGPPSS